jgi:hypothetical protein
MFRGRQAISEQSHVDNAWGPDAPAFPGGGGDKSDYSCRLFQNKPEERMGPFPRPLFRHRPLLCVIARKRGEGRLFWQVIIDMRFLPVPFQDILTRNGSLFHSLCRTVHRRRNPWTPAPATTPRPRPSPGSWQRAPPRALVGGGAAWLRVIFRRRSWCLPVQSDYRLIRSPPAVTAPHAA